MPASIAMEIGLGAPSKANLNFPMEPAGNQNQNSAGKIYMYIYISQSTVNSDHVLGMDLSRLTEGLSQEETCSRERRTISEPVDTSSRQPACSLPVQQACVAGTVSQQVNKRS